MKLPKLNPVQKSLLIPSGATFILGGVFGVGGFAIGGLAALVASPVIYWRGTDSQKAKWKRVLTASLLSGSGMFLSVISGSVGAETVLRAVRPDAYRQYQKETAKTSTELNRKEERSQAKTSTESESKKEKSQTKTSTQPNKEEEKAQANTTDWRSKISHEKRDNKDASKVQVAKAPPAKQMKATFTTTTYFVDARPEVTQGQAILSKTTKTVEWYTEVKDGGYAGYKYYHRCATDGKYWEKDKYSGGVWKQDSDMRCNISASAESTPRQFKVVASDGFLSQTVQVSTSAATKPKVSATPVRTLPDKTTVIVQCKKLVLARTATGKVNWNAFGTGDPRWYAPAATVMLSGKTKNKYGTTVPFTVECRGNSDGNVRLVEIKQ